MSLVFWVLAAICKAIGDILAFNYYASVFQNLNPLKHNPQTNWQKGGAYNLFGWVRIDIYHCSVFLLLAFFTITIVHFKPLYPTIVIFGLQINLITYIIYCFAWFIPFELATRLLKRPYKSAL